MRFLFSKQANLHKPFDLNLGDILHIDQLSPTIEAHGVKNVVVFKILGHGGKRDLPSAHRLLDIVHVGHGVLPRKLTGKHAACLRSTRKPR